MANNQQYVGPIFTVVGTLMIAAGIYFFIDVTRFTDKAEKTVGEVISVKTNISHDSDGRRSVTYEPTIRFRSIDGDTYSAETHISSSEYDYVIGTEVEILYDPSDLDEVRINGFWSLYIFPGVFTIVGAFFSIIGLFVWRHINRRGSASLAQAGIAQQSRTIRRSRDD